MNYVISFVSFLVMFLFETSFLTSLPFPMGMTPLVFAMGIYLLQHRGLLDGFFWICGYGLFLQLLHLSSTPFVFVLFFIGGIVSFLSSRHLFSNRSLYGVVACGVAGFLSFLFLEAIAIAIVTRSHEVTVPWRDLLLLGSLRILVLIITMIFIYLIASPLKTFLQKNR